MAWVVGDLCTALFSEDNQGYTAEIKEIHADDGGSHYALVEFHGYGNLETVWLDDLMPLAAAKKEVVDSNNNNQSVSDNDITLHPLNTSPSAAKVDLTLNGAVDLDVSHYPLSQEEKVKHNGSLSQEIDDKLDLIESLSQAKSALETAGLKYTSLGTDYLHLQKRFDEELIKRSELEDEKKVLQEKVDKTRNLYTAENVELKSKLKEMLELQGRWNRERESLETQIRTLSKRVNNLNVTADDTVKSCQDKITQLENELQELRISKEGGNTSGGSETKNPINNSMNTTISLDRDDSVTDMPSPMRGGGGGVGSHPLIPMSAESERCVSNLLNTGPIQMGDVFLQPVLCYLPILAANNGPTMSQELSLPSFSTPRVAAGSSSRQLRRPLPSTEFSSRYPNSEGKLGTICLDPSGSLALVKEIEDPSTLPGRVTEIMVELKSHVLQVSKDKWGHQVILALLLVSPYASCHDLVSEIWSHFSSIMGSPFGVDVLLSTLKRMPNTLDFSALVERAVKSTGSLPLAISEGGNRILISVLDRFKSPFLSEVVNTHADKLILDPRGGKVLTKALAVFPHEAVAPAIALVIDNASLIEQGSREALSIFEAVLENHLGAPEDGCVDALMKSISPHFKIVLNRFLDTTTAASAGSFHLKV